MRTWPTLLVILSVAPPALAGMIPAPKLEPGRFVYTVPPGFDPPLIGRAGMDEIQAAAARLHYPYYVVLVERLPGSTDDDAADAVDGLAEDWSRNEGYSVQRSSIFLLSFTPRKYRFLAGSEWKSRLGFEREAHAPYTDLFDRSVQGTPKDPRSGIIAMMRAVDAYLFDHTDPKRIAAREAAVRKQQELERRRKEAERTAAEARRLDDARGVLDDQVAQMRYSLDSPARFLPPDVKPDEALLERARTVRTGQDRDAILQLAAELRGRANALGAYVQERAMEEEAQRQQEQTRRFLAWFAAAVALAGAIGWSLVFRRRRRAFEAALGRWNERVVNAKSRYVEFYGDRESVRKLVEPKGATATLYSTVTAEIDDIYLGVSAVESRLQECQAEARRAGLLWPAPLSRAAGKLTAPIEFDTGKVNPADLFGAETKVVRVEPEPFFAELEERFRTSVGEWNRLKAAIEMRYTPAQDHFSQATLDAMIATADAQDIPHAWLSDHPLYGDDETDQNLYDRVNADRWEDPVAYADALASLKAKEDEVRSRLDRIVAAIALTREGRLDAVPPLPDIVLAPDDDPCLTLEKARAELLRFEAAVATGKDVDRVEEEARLVAGLHAQCAAQIAAAQEAAATAPGAVGQARAAMADTTERESEASTRLARAEAVHAQTGAVVAALESGRAKLAEGRQQAGDAEARLAQRRCVEALRLAQAAVDAFAAADADFGRCVDECDELDRQKAEYERKLAALESEYGRARSRMRRYGGDLGRLEPFQGPTFVSQTTDYAALLGLLAAHQSRWESEVRTARRAYEEEQRQREAAEASARRARESSLSSSSSSHSWGGGGHSSSSGGSWGGGSSSSRSSSSGGNW